jgi:Na+(H+)/acetate symporter ActP
MSEEEIYQLARKRVEEKKGFLVHLIVYAVVNAILVLIWLGTGAGFPWFVFPLGGWGIGILFHFLGVFVFSQQTGWEKKAVEKEAERIRKNLGK